MGNATAEELVNNKVLQKYIEGIDSDACDALDTADWVLKSPTAKLYSSSTLSTYKADYKRLDTCMGNFNAAWNKAAFGKAKSNKELISTYSKYVLALEVLEQSNIRHAAMVSAGFALACAALCNLLIEWSKAIKKRCAELEKELKDLEKLIKKAKAEITEAQIQTGLNLALTAVSMCLGPVGWGARIGVAVGGLAAHTIVDAALGPSSGSAQGAVNNTVAESADLVDKLGKGGKRLVGAATAVYSLKMDLDEVGDAEKILKEVQKRMTSARDSYLKLLRLSANFNKDIIKLKRGYDTSLKAYEAAAGKFKSSQTQRQKALKEFKKWK